MRGMFRNDLYIACVNVRIFSAFMLLYGIFSVACASLYNQMNFVLIGIVGFSVNSVVAVFHGESTSKWGKYKLTLPVRRRDIVKSVFLSHIFWLFAGVLFTGTGTGLFALFHGYSFEQYREVFLIFALGISAGLLIGAIFIPLFYLGGEDRTIALLTISLLCAIGIAALLVNVTTNVDYLLRLAVIFAVSFMAIAVSYWLTLCIFKRKEY